MLVNDEIQRQLLQLFAKSSNVPRWEAEQQSASQLQLSPGQQVQAEVMSRLPNHLFLARIAGEMFKMELPLNVQPGETVHLTYITAEPRPTFELVRENAGGGTVSISNMGRWISSLVREGGLEANTLQLSSALKVLDGPPLDTAHLAERLREAMTGNGLFYESHLASWAAGGKQLSELLREPQGRLSRRLKAPALESGNEEMENVSHSEGMPMATSTGESSGSEQIADPSTFSLIKEQLATLSSGQLFWHGQIWPGQEMEITISEQEKGRGQDDQSLDNWKTSVTVHLPVLGRVTAVLGFESGGLRVALSADKPETIDLLEREGAQFVEKLTETGTGTAVIVVGNEQK